MADQMKISNGILLLLLILAMSLRKCKEEILNDPPAPVRV